MIVDEELNQTIIQLNPILDDNLECFQCKNVQIQANNCHFCGQSICKQCIVKQRKFTDNLWHPICRTCENCFIQELIQIRFSTIIESNQQELDQKYAKLQEKRQKIFQLKELTKNDVDSIISSQQKLMKQAGEVVNELENKKSHLQEAINQQDQQINGLQEVLDQKWLNIQMKETQLFNLSEQCTREQEYLQKLQISIDEMMLDLQSQNTNYNNQEDGAKSSQITNYEGIFRSMAKSDSKQFQSNIKKQQQTKSTKQVCIIC